MNKPFVMEILYATSVEELWDALTDEARMREWYFPQLKRFKPEIGFNFEFVDDGSRFQKEWRVTQIVEKRKVAHSWTYKGYSGESEVVFELSAEGDKTRLKLTHFGLASFPQDPHFERSRFEAGWHNILGNNLKTHLKIPR